MPLAVRRQLVRNPMEVLRRPGPGGWARSPGCVATIGVFDGLHRGHERILDRVKTVAAERGLKSLVFSFEPVPAEVLGRGEPPARLMRFREKAERLCELGLDALFCPPFDARMAALAPEDFIRSLLVETLGVRHLVVGDDFRFGHRRAGSVADLEAAGPRYGYTTEQVGSFVTAGVRVSSTAVREALAAGDLDRATALLGRPYRMSGRVRSGQRLGRSLGFPTANLQVGRRRCPVSGIFAVRVLGLAPEALPAVASVGTRPTVDGVEPLLEVHVFDFDRDIYGRHIQVDFIARLRDEVRFPDLDSMRCQMEQDAADARRILGVD
jgi:riboflavin kinase/FMN adenylyltransferase